MRPKILAVDDEPEILMVIEGRLRPSGYDVVTAGSGMEAVEKIKKEKPNLVILDIGMPQMDGFQVLEILKNNPSTFAIPVIMLTAKGETRHILKAQEMRAEDYLIKPFKDEELVRAVQKYI